MELVYLWVEDYKNIHQQGFNFSSDIEYKKGILSRSSSSSDIPKDFFGKNVDVTAIIGKNGSGKSGLIESLMLTFFRNIDQSSTLKAFCIFKENDQYFYQLSPAMVRKEILDFLGRNKSFFTGDFDQSDFGLEKYDLLNKQNTMIFHYNYTIDNFSSQFKNTIRDSEFYGHIFSYETTTSLINVFSQPDKSKENLNVNSLNRNTQKYMIKAKTLFTEEDLQNILIDVFGEGSNANFIPKKFILKFDFDTYLAKFNNLRVRDSLKAYFAGDDFNDLSNLNIDKLLTLANFFFIFRVFESFWGENRQSYIKIKEFIEILDSIDKHDAYLTNNKDKVDADFIFKQNIFDTEFLESILGGFEQICSNLENIRENLLKDIKTLFPDIYDTAWYIDYVLGKGQSIKKLDIDLFLSITPINSHIVEELIKNLPSFVEIEFWNDTGVNFNDLSYGEKIFNRLFYNLFFFFDFYRSKGFSDFKIILDEIEIGLHPDWQKRFVFMLTKIGQVLVQRYEGTSIHFILASHSSFLLSDLPKQNVIFLDRDVDGKCIVKNSMSNNETFGANIHTLLSHGFFMKDGLMGEFAKEKINKAIRYLNQEQLSEEEIEYCENIISIIGEPVLKSTLKTMIDNKKYASESKIDKLKRQQKEIEEAILKEEQRVKSNEES
ncbi:AAA family ATPase [Sulfuricurvum sp.]|uniref:AAA family ATPase n=1 Tax=Sulfuricurvum sp. TaxID=2025608 RepID=UPI002608F654|nr:AAA family ATPase [Sulfuricurvum sp.]MDD3598041.1 AAA family ATPase [Sulfuricurvum sp.]